MGYADFRHGGRIFATVGCPNAAFGMVKLTPDQQGMLLATTPKVFVPVSRGWGRRGYTNETDHYVGWPAVLVRTSAVSDAELAHCVERAWRLQAPKKLQAGRAANRPAKRRKSLQKASPVRKSSRTGAAPKA